MTTATFIKRAGDNAHQSTEDPAMQLFGDVVPDWVDVPPQAGGGRRTVQRHCIITCPCNPHAPKHKVRELDLGRNLFVSECPHRGFLWYNR